MAANIKPVAQLDFSGGANLVVNPYLISQKQAADIQNMLLEEHGSLRSRDGVRLLTTSPDLVSPIRFRGILLRNDGQEFPFAIQGDETGGSAVSFDTSGSGSFSGTSKTLAATLGGTATLLIVAVHFGSSSETTVTGITYDGVALSRIQRKQASASGAGVAAELWGLFEPTVSSSKNIVAHFSGTTTGLLAWHSYVGGKSWGAPIITTGTGTEVTATVNPSTVDSIVVDAVTAAGSSTTYTPGVDQTEIYDTAAGDDRGTGSRKAGAASVVMSHTLSTSKLWVQVAASINSTGGNTLYDTTIEPWSDEGNLNEESLPDAIYMSDKVVILHGYSTPKTWDGTTLAPITADAGQTVPPGAKHGEFHLGALWLWNTNPSTTTLDGPSALRASSVNDENDWPNANSIFISKDDGQEGMGMSPFTIVETGISPTSTLVLFKNYSGYQVTGVFGASTFSIQPIKSDMGCVAPRTIQFVSGFGVIRLTHKGFALYNGVEDRLISEEMRPAIFGGHDFDSLDFGNIQLSWATQCQNPPLYVAACPVSGRALTRLFIYDLIRRGWTICTLPITLSTLNLYFTRTSFPVIHGGEVSGGGIYELFNGADDDQGGVAIPWSLKTRTFFAGNQMTPAYWRRAQISLNIEPNTNVSVTPIVDGSERAAQDFAIPDSSPPGDHTVNVVISPDILETAHTLQLLIEGEGHNHLRGLEFHVSQKPSTKYVSRA